MTSLLIGQKKDVSDNKAFVMKAVDEMSNELTSLSDEIWSYAETAFEELSSAKALADYAEKQGFKVERGVAEIPTAFIATYGSGSPVIGILGEFDALPGLSQQTSPDKNPVEEGKPGHGCGHNLFGVGSLAAAIAAKKLMEQGKLKGTLKFFGTPAEEKYFGKLFMARAGLFDDLEICLDWHPSAKNVASTQSSQALIDFIVEFRGQAAHAAADPWNGRSALDALELYTTGINFLREHVEPTVRMHYQIQHGGDVVNVVPDYARVWTRVRDSKRENMMKVYERMKKCAEGAALMTETKYELKLVSGLHEILVNRTGAEALQKNMEIIGPIFYTEEEIRFAHGIQKATGKDQIGIDGEIYPLEPTRDNPPGGSTDVGDVSWIVPEISLGATTAPIGTPWHSWAVVACGGMSIGHKGMLFAAKALGMTLVDVFENENLRKNMQAEFKERKGNYEYKPILPEGPAPIPAHILEKQ